MPKMNAAGLSGAILLGALSLGFNQVAAQEPFSQFQTTASENGPAIDYGTIDTLYQQVTEQKGDRYEFRYAVLNQRGLPILDDLTEGMARIDPTTLSKDEQLAYWLNLRNLLVIHAIAADLPGRSFRRLRGDFAQPGEMWTRKRLSVNGVSLSIDDIERHIILANWSDPNVIYGLYQGAEGGVPFYPPKNFTGHNVQEDLAARGRHFVNSRRVIRVRRGKVRVPAIYDWYKADLFGGDDAAVIAHIQTVADGDLSADLAGVEDIEFNKMDYGLDEVVVREERQQFPQGSRGGSFGS